jgi:hypothetical protein
VSSVDRVREREALKCYLDQLERADEENEVVIDASAVTGALEKLKRDPEPGSFFHDFSSGAECPRSDEPIHPLGNQRPGCE